MDENHTFPRSTKPKMLADVKNTNENRFSGLDYDLMKELFKKGEITEASQLLCGSPLSTLDFEFSQNSLEDEIMIGGTCLKDSTASLIQSTLNSPLMLDMMTELSTNDPVAEHLLQKDLAVDQPMTDSNSNLSNLFPTNSLHINIPAGPIIDSQDMIRDSVPVSNSSSPSLMPETFDFRGHCQSPGIKSKDDDETDCETPVKQSMPLNRSPINEVTSPMILPMEQNASCAMSTTRKPNVSSSSETEIDDSDADPDYENQVRVSDIINTSQELSSSDCDTENNENIEPKKTRKRRANPENWERNRVKLLRNSGHAYRTLKKRNVVPTRKMGPPCINSCRRKCTQKFTEDERRELFKFFWSLKDLTKQRQFIANSMKKIERKNQKHVLAENSRVRKLNHMFTLLKEGESVAVCKRFFASTLAISSRCIRTVIDKTDKGLATDDLRGKHKNHATISEEVKDSARIHISSIPTVESHYTRANSSKNYIEGGRCLIDLYSDYKQNCLKENHNFVSFAIYRQIFNYEFNLEFFKPKKDLCQFCESYKNKTHSEKLLIEVEFMRHHEEKTLSRTEKENDKTKISTNYRVACFDLQAALPTPKGEVSTFYYKSKLSTYNFTICDLNIKGLGTVNCYVWHEGEGHKGSNEIGSCLLHYLKMCASQESVAGCSKVSDSDEVEIVLYSDNCGGQGKNKFIIATYLYAVSNYNIKSITHKFLVVGHTQNEGDVSHSLIEKNIKKALKSNPIYLPSQYATLISTAKKSSPTFKVHELDHDFFFDLKDLVETTATNFNVNKDGDKFNFNDICVLRVEKDNPGVYFYKTSYKEESYKTVNIISTRTRKQLKLLKDIQLKKAYPEKLPITERKYNDLVSLVRSNTIPSCYSDFYLNLKHEG